MTTVMSIKTDKELKAKAQHTAEEMGFALGTLINAFLRQLVKDKAVSFSVEPTIKMSKRAEKELGEIEDDIKHGRNLSPKFSDMKSAIAYLRKQ